MREIKFRIYFKDEEPFMSEPITLTELLHEDWIEFGDEKGEWSLPLKDFRFFYRKNENYEVMQYTGLKDKNGKEIYEGDIINIQYDVTVQIEKAVIEYRGASFYAVTNADTWELDNYEEIAVIGNIYENPELLEIQN